MYWDDTSSAASSSNVAQASRTMHLRSESSPVAGLDWCMCFSCEPERPIWWKCATPNHYEILQFSYKGTAASPLYFFAICKNDRLQVNFLIEISNMDKGTSSSHTHAIDSLCKQSIQSMHVNAVHAQRVADCHNNILSWQGAELGRQGLHN